MYGIYDMKYYEQCVGIFNGREQLAKYFNTTSEYGITPNKYITLGDTSFTIDAMFCSYSNLDDTTYDMLWDLTLNTPTNNHEGTSFYKSKLQVDFYNVNQFYINISNIIKSGEWFHIAFTYNYETNKYSLYINGSLIETKESNISDKIIRNLYVHIAKVYNKANAFKKGKIAYFRIEKDLLFTENFDWQSILSNNIKIESNNNTKRAVTTNYKQINYKSFEFM